MSITEIAEKVWNFNFSINYLTVYVIEPFGISAVKKLKAFISFLESFQSQQIC